MSMVVTCEYEDVAEQQSLPKPTCLQTCGLSLCGSRMKTGKVNRTVVGVVVGQLCQSKVTHGQLTKGQTCVPSASCLSSLKMILCNHSA